jgi:hypothetical protein
MFQGLKRTGSQYESKQSKKSKTVVILAEDSQDAPIPASQISGIGASQLSIAQLEMYRLTPRCDDDADGDNHNNANNNNNNANNNNDSANDANAVNIILSNNESSDKSSGTVIPRPAISAVEYCKFLAELNWSHEYNIMNYEIMIHLFKFAMNNTSRSKTIYVKWYEDKEKTMSLDIQHIIKYNGFTLDGKIELVDEFVISEAYNSYICTKNQCEPFRSSIKQKCYKFQVSWN